MERHRHNLVVTRKKGESILIGDTIEVVVVDVRSNGQVRLAIKAPKDVVILRAELIGGSKQ